MALRHWRARCWSDITASEGRVFSDTSDLLGIMTSGLKVRMDLVSTGNAQLYNWRKPQHDTLLIVLASGCHRVLSPICFVQRINMEGLRIRHIGAKEQVYSPPL